MTQAQAQPQSKPTAVTEHVVAAIQKVAAERDVRAAGVPEHEEAAAEAATKMDEKALDALSVAELRERLAKAEETNAQHERLHKKWVLGDYSDLAPEHPFEIFIYNDDNPWTEPTVTVTHNGHDHHIMRGQPQRVPKYIVDQLDHAKVDGVQTLVTPDGQRKVVHVIQHRFPFSAHPVY